MNYHGRGHFFTAGRVRTALPVPRGAAGDSYERLMERMGGDTPLPHPGDESGMTPVSGIGSERAQVASVCYEEAPPEPRAPVGVKRLQASARYETVSDAAL